VVTAAMSGGRLFQIATGTENRGDRLDHFLPLPAQLAAPNTVAPMRKSLMARFVRQAYSLTAMWIRASLSPTSQ
jgi:hypothetical protein